MKINDSSRVAGIPPARSASQSRRPARADSVQLSPEIAARETKLRDLQSAVDARTYRVAPELIAASMIADSLKS